MKTLLTAALLGFIAGVSGLTFVLIIAGVMK